MFVQDGKAGPPGQATEGMLANFFNSLLNKKTGAAVAGKGLSTKPCISLCEGVVASERLDLNILSAAILCVKGLQLVSDWI